MSWTPITNIWNQISVATDVDPKDIVVCEECQPRVNGIDSDIVAEYAADMQEYDKGSIPGIQMFPQLRCVKTVGNELILVSGFHRLQAMIENEYEKINVCYVEGTFQDAVMLSKLENKKNGVRRTNADIRHIVCSCLRDPELGQWSNSQIAKWCGVSPKTVDNHDSSLRKLSSETGWAYNRPSKRKSINKHGKVELIDIAKIGKNGKSPSVKEREENKLLKQKKKTFNSLWESRRNVTKIYMSDSDTELNTYLTLQDLEKNYPKYNSFLVDEFKSALERTSNGSFENALQRILDANISLDILDKELRAMRTYEADVRTWNSSTAASGWIRDLIYQKKQRTPEQSDKRRLVRYYAQIVHHNKEDAPYSNTNELWFESNEQRNTFIDEFNAYHAEHDHKREAPTISIVKAADLTAGQKSQAKAVFRDGELCVDYDGWFGPEKQAKIRYFAPTCVVDTHLEKEEAKSDQTNDLDHRNDETQDTGTFTAGGSHVDVLTLTLVNSNGDTKDIKFHNNIRVKWKLSDKSEERLPCLDDIPAEAINLEVLWQFLRDMCYLEE